MLSVKLATIKKLQNQINQIVSELSHGSVNQAFSIFLLKFWLQTEKYKKKKKKKKKLAHFWSHSMSKTIYLFLRIQIDLRTIAWKHLVICMSRPPIPQFRNSFKIKTIITIRISIDAHRWITYEIHFMYQFNWHLELWFSRVIKVLCSYQFLSFLP